MEKGALASDAMDVVAGQELSLGLVRNLGYYDALPIHPSPKRLESLTGYLTRLCEANEITSVDALVSLCFSSQSRRVAREQTDFPPLSLASLAVATTSLESALLMTTFQPIGQKFGRAAHPQPLSRFLAGSLASHFRFCPVCLVEDPYYQLTWRFRVITGCAAHNCHLLDRCSHCQVTLPLLSAPLKVGVCSSCRTSLSLCESEPLTETDQVLTYIREEDLRFLLTARIQEPSIGSVVEAVGAQFATLRRLRRYTAEEAAQKIRATLSSVEGIERGQMAKGATLACYFRYADMLKVTLRDIFALALPDAMLDEMQSDLTIQQSLKHALDAMVLEQVHRAMHQLEIRGHAITQQAIGEIVQMTPQGLKRYPSVRVVLEQLASNNRDHQQHEADMQVQHLLEQVRSAAILLQARGEPVTQRAIGRVLQIPWSSLRTHAAIKAVLREVAGSRTE